MGRTHVVQAEQFGPRRLKARSDSQYNGEAINTICTISSLHRVKNFSIPLDGILVYSLVTRWTSWRETMGVKNVAQNITQ